MAKIKWTKEDVIKKFQEAVTPGLSKPGGRPNVLQGLLDKAKKIRQVNRRNWREFYSDIMTLTWWQRLRIAWYLVTHKRGTHK